MKYGVLFLLFISFFNSNSSISQNEIEIEGFTVKKNKLIQNMLNFVPKGYKHDSSCGSNYLVYTEKKEHTIQCVIAFSLFKDITIAHLKYAIFHFFSNYFTVYNPNKYCIKAIISSEELCGYDYITREAFPENSLIGEIFNRYRGGSVLYITPVNNQNNNNQ